MSTLGPRPDGPCCYDFLLNRINRRSVAQHSYKAWVYKAWVAYPSPGRQFVTLFCLIEKTGAR